MDHIHHDHSHHHGSLNSLALTATLHCLTGCAIGEVLGMVIGNAAGFSAGATVALSVALAFLFGYTLTSIPLLRAGLAFKAALLLALACDTLSIFTMEIVDNSIMLAAPGAMDAHLTSLTFWGWLSFALLIAGICAYPVNRYLLSKGRGHALVHEYH
jgi:Domain of unknown function (DUF4396)